MFLNNGAGQPAVTGCTSPLLALPSTVQLSTYTTDSFHITQYSANRCSNMADRALLDTTSFASGQNTMVTFSLSNFLFQMDWKIWHLLDLYLWVCHLPVVVFGIKESLTIIRKW